MFRPYLCVLRTPGVALLFCCAFLGALPISMLGLSEFLLVQSTTGSFAQAGAVSGAVTVGNAVGLLVQGRLIDRRGQSAVLVPAGLLCGVSLVLLTLAALRHATLPLLVGLAALAGVSIPAVTACMRVLIPELLPATRRRTAYALLGTQFQLALVSGPLVVSAILVLAAPWLAVLLAAVAATCAGLAFGTTRASRGWRPARLRPGGRGRGPLAIMTPGLRTLLVSAFGVGVGGGLTAVAVPAVAITEHAAALAGPLFAAASVGEVLGGFGFGSRSWRGGLRSQLCGCLSGTAVVSGLLAAATGHPAAMLVLMFLGGVVQAPGGIATSALLDDVSLPGFLGQSYASMVAAGLVGVAVGSAMGGTLTKLVSESLLFAVAGGVTSVVVAWTLLRRRTISSGQSAVAPDRAEPDGAAEPDGVTGRAAVDR
ncbi:MAG TPA: MFS transporter [Actinopolymorphaceae bacterium]|nr:MFS transporter [Actinopolymorphaceae bacterium]